VRTFLELEPGDPINVIGLHGFDVDPAFGEALELSDEQKALRKQLTTVTLATLENLGVTYRWLPLPVHAAAESAIPCVLLEEKATSIAIHVRRLPADQRDRVLAAIEAGPARLRGVVTKAGAMVLELAVTNVSKSDGVRLVRQHFAGQRLLFLGDDITDLDAIAELTFEDATVLVDQRLPNLVAANRRGTLRSELTVRLTPEVVARLDHAVALPDPGAAVELLRQWYRTRAETVAPNSRLALLS
jgi:hypothetical protein